MDKYKITDSELESGVVAAPNILNDTPQENKSVFDRLPRLIANKVNGFIDAVISKFTDYYNKTEIDSKENVLNEAINTKANAADVYKKTETYTKGEVDGKETALSDRINAKANSADVYAKSETYTKAETDEAIAQRVTELGAGDMAKAVYDTDGDGVVDDAEKLNGQPASYYATKQYVDNKTKMDLLWENASPNSQQPAQAITINHEGYKFFIAAAKGFFRNENPDMFTIFMHKDWWGGYFTGHDAGIIVTRRLYFRENDLWITDGSKGTNVDNSRCVVSHIWGVK